MKVVEKSIKKDPSSEKNIELALQNDLNALKSFLSSINPEENIKDDLSAVKTFIRNISEKHKKTYEEILILLKTREQAGIPVSIFEERTLGILECVVKYLKENLDQSYHQIAETLNRDDRTIWATYDAVLEKHPQKFQTRSDSTIIPLDIFKDRNLGVLETLTIYLKEELNMSFKEIGLMLNRDNKTIWTVYSRAKKKTR